MDPNLCKCEGFPTDYVSQLTTSSIQRSSSKADSTSNPTTDTEQEPHNDMTPPQTANRVNSVQMPIPNTQSAPLRSTRLPVKQFGLVPEPQDGDVWTGSLVPKPLPARLDCTHSPAPSGMNEKVITVTGGLEHSEIFLVV